MGPTGSQKIIVAGGGVADLIWINMRRKTFLLSQRPNPASPSFRRRPATVREKIRARHDNRLVVNAFT